MFLSSIASVIICDYYVVRKGYVQLQDLYRATPSSPYFYWFGFHWRGYVAYIAGILINIVGFVGALGATVPVGAQYIYNLDFFCGFIVSFGVYYLLCRISPIPVTSDRWMEVGDDFGDTSMGIEPPGGSDWKGGAGSEQVREVYDAGERKDKLEV